MLKQTHRHFFIDPTQNLKQGCIHGYPSRARVDRGNDEFDQPSSWAGAVTPKPPINAKKAKRDRPTDGPTDRRTDRAGCRVACTRLKNVQITI